MDAKAENDQALDDSYGIRAWMRADPKKNTQHELARRASALAGFKIAQQRISSVLSPPGVSGAERSTRYMPFIVKAMEGDNNTYPMKRKRRLAVVRYPKTPTLDTNDDIPAYDLNKNTTGGLGIMNSEVARWVTRPGNLSHVSDAYGVQAREVDMRPMYRPGDILIVNPRLAPRVEDGVLLLSEDKTNVQIGEFVSESADMWVVKKYGDNPETFTFSRAEFPACHPVCLVFPGRN